MFVWNAHQSKEFFIIQNPLAQGWKFLERELQHKQALSRDIVCAHFERFLRKLGSCFSDSNRL